MQFSRALRALPVVFWLGPAAPDASLAAQARYRITTDGAWFFQEAGGKRLARLARGAQVAGGDARGDWLAVTLEGWIFATSVGPTPRAGFDLAVTRTPEENLRSAPRSEEHTSELQSRFDLVCRLLLEKQIVMRRP